MVKFFFIIEYFLIITMSCLTMDLKTPRNVYLTAFYKRSFAHHTVKNRMPLILTQIIDGLARSKNHIKEQYGENSQEDLKKIIGELSKLKYEIQTNKSLTYLTSETPDAKFYNEYMTKLNAQQGDVAYFSTIWLLSECYMYRRIREIFEITTTLNNYDPFFKQKTASFHHALPLFLQLGEQLETIINISNEPELNDFKQLLKINLWGNKCDLSLSNGVVGGSTHALLDITKYEEQLLVDQSDKIWETIVNSENDTQIIDIVLDNAGYELFTDFCFADYLVTMKLAKTVRFYVKTIPWFVSDTTAIDVNWFLDELSNQTDQVLQKLGQRWLNYFVNNSWTIIENDFWILPVDFSHMMDVNPNLYKQLAQAQLVIFKGDLNYRKLFGEKNWDPITPVDQGLQGFHPAKLCTLRTIKSDIICGLPAGLAQKLDVKDPKWMETGDYGVIQFSDKIVTKD